MLLPRCDFQRRKRSAPIEYTTNSVLFSPWGLGYWPVGYEAVLARAPTKDKFGRLQTRKQVVATTLAYIQRMQSEVEQNAEWQDLHAQKRRHMLLANLRSTYETELSRIMNRLAHLARRPH